MEKDKNIGDDKIKTDLKHDTMEFTTSANGDEPVAPVEIISDEEEALDAEVLDAIEDEPENEAAALDATETDLEADDDQLPDEDWTDDLPDADKEANKNHHRP